MDYKVVTLCGSTRFKDEFFRVQKELTLQGCIVISVGLFGHSGDQQVWQEGVKEMLDDMHKRKIDMAEEIYVINPGGYIGSSTRSEIAYARAHGKKINYLQRATVPEITSLAPHQVLVVGEEAIFGEALGEVLGESEAAAGSEVLGEPEAAAGGEVLGESEAAACRKVLGEPGTTAGSEVLGEPEAADASLVGQRYILPILPNSPETLPDNVARFLTFARSHLQTDFLVTRLGCPTGKGTAGDGSTPAFEALTETEAFIASLFEAARTLENVFLPPAWNPPYTI